MGTLSGSSNDIVVDETSCGPLCQHPACWASNQRQEKGFPQKREYEQPTLAGYDDDLELPKMTVYNIIEEYGEDPHDRFPAQHCGRPTHNRLSSSLPELSRSQEISKKTGEGIRAIMGGTNTKIVESPKAPRMKVVEVQEVFDVEDLNSQWDETFITSPYYVWVPKSKTSPQKPSTVIPSTDITQTQTDSRVTTKAHTVLPKDMTEQLIPEDVEKQREEAKVKKHASTPVYSRGNTFSRGTQPAQRSARPFIDSDSLRELLELPRDILMNVLEHMKESDLTSRDKVHSVVSQYRPVSERQLTPTSTSIGPSELLKQKKVRLLGSKEKNYRNPDLMMTRPVFQMDSEFESARTIEVKVPIKNVVSESSSSQDEMSVKGLPHFKKPLPAIPGTASAPGRFEGLTKIPSVSLGLPELPSGIRQTRPFTYKKQHTMDLSLGPVPTPPESDRSSMEVGSEHGTTMRVNVTSASTRQDKRYSRETTAMTDSSLPMHGVSPSTSARLPKTPLGTPVTRSSPTKMSFDRDKTNSSGQNASRSPPLSRDTTLSPTQKVVAPANSPNQSPGTSPEPATRGLVTIPEMEDGSVRQTMSSLGKVLSSDDGTPRAPPASMKEGQVYTIRIGKMLRDKSTETSKDTSIGTRVLPSPCSVSSAEEWPIVNESVYEAAPYPHSTGIRPASEELARISSAERNSKTPGSKCRSNIGSRESDKSSLARVILEESVKTESPGPPPPSPESKERKKTDDRKNKDLRKQDTKSREGLGMAPLYEESELREVRTAKEAETLDPGVMTTVSEVSPQPRKGGHEISVDTFVNVDIQATRDQVGSTFRSEYPASGDTTRRTETGGYASNEDSTPDTPFTLKTPDTFRKDVNDNRAVSSLSKDDTDLAIEKHPEKLTEALVIEAVDYSKVTTEDSGIDKNGEEHTEPPAEAELEQESSFIVADENDFLHLDETSSRTVQGTFLHENMNTERERNIVGSVIEAAASQLQASLQADQLGQQEDAASETEDDTFRESLVGDKQDETEENVGNKPDGAQCPEEASGNTVEKPEGEDTSIDVNIPPPVSRTNTAIQIVKSVIEAASDRVDELVKNGHTNEDQM